MSAARDWRVRAAGTTDAQALLVLEAAFPGDRLSMRSIRHLLRSPAARIRVAEAGDGRVIGAIVLLTRRGARAARVYSLAVEQAARGRGVAAGLVRAAEAEAAAQGCNRLRLEVREDNAAARALYAGLGYASVERLSGYYEDGADGLRLEKRLPRD